MLRREDAHAPYLDAAPGARESVQRAAAEVEKALEDDRWEGFAWLAREVEQEERKTGTGPYHLPRYGDTIAEAQALAGRPGLSEDERAVVGSWLRYDADAARLCGEIRNWQGRTAALQDDRPPPDAALETLTGWRERAEALLDESRAMRAEDGPHAPHLTAMPRERKALDGAVRKLDAAAAAVEIAETGWLMKSGLEFEERTGGMAYDAPIHDALMERVRSLEARGKLPKKWRETVDDVLGYDEWCGRDRRQVGAFLDAAREVEDARDDLEAEARMRSMPAERLTDWEDLREKAVSVVHKAKALVEEIPERELAAHLAAFGAGPDGIGERQEKIREQIARDVQARAAAEEERRAADQALIAEYAEIARIGADRIRAAAKQADVGPEREAETRRERPPVHDTPQPPARAAPEADRAADRLDAAWNGATGCWSGRNASSATTGRWSISAGGIRVGGARRTARSWPDARRWATSATAPASMRPAAATGSSAPSIAWKGRPSSTACPRASRPGGRSSKTVSGRPGATVSSCRSTKCCASKCPMCAIASGIPLRGSSSTASSRCASA